MGVTIQEVQSTNRN